MQLEASLRLLCRGVSARGDCAQGSTPGLCTRLYSPAEEDAPAVQVPEATDIRPCATQVQGGSADAAQLYEVVTAQLEASQRLLERLRVLWLDAQLPGSFPEPPHEAPHRGSPGLPSSAGSLGAYGTPSSAVSSK